MRVFRATRVEHGHSIGEHIIYEVLWRNAVGDQTSRTIQIGYDRLATLASVNWKTAQSCLKSLEQKLAIEVISPEDSNRRVGKTYRIYCFTTILERRRAAGMEWVEKGRGVRFIPGTVVESGTVPESTTVPETGMDTPPETGTDTVPDSGTPLGKTIRKKEEETSSSAIVQRTAKLGIVLDDDAGRKLLRRCQAADPQATEEEVAHFTEVKVLQLKRSPRIDNWVGMLIASVPLYFQAPATELARYREDRRHQAEQGRETARKILEDPEAGEQEREWAKSVIG
jgi:hypothetical protein